MQAYRVATTVMADGELLLHELPLKAGEAVEVIILRLEGVNGKTSNGSYPDAVNGSQPPSSTESLREREAAWQRIRSGMHAIPTQSGLLASEEFALRKTEEKWLEERKRG